MPVFHADIIINFTAAHGMCVLKVCQKDDGGTQVSTQRNLGTHSLPTLVNIFSHPIDPSLLPANNVRNSTSLQPAFVATACKTTK